MSQSAKFRFSQGDFDGEIRNSENAKNRKSGSEIRNPRHGRKFENPIPDGNMYIYGNIYIYGPRNKYIW